MGNLRRWLSVCPAVRFFKKPPPFAVVAADGGFLERNRKKGYLLLR